MRQYRVIKHTILLIAISFLFFPSFLSAETVAVILFTKGKVYANRKRLRLGDRISATDQIKTGPKSACELQLLKKDSPVVIRLKENTSFSIAQTKGKKGMNYRAVVKSGKALFNVNKLGGSKLNVISPTSVAGIRGTKFEVNVRENGENHSATLEGAVSSRLRIPELESMDNSLLESNKSLQKVVKSLNKKSVMVKKGAFMNLSENDNSSFLKKSGLAKALDPTDDSQSVALAKKDFSKQANPAKIKLRPRKFSEKVEEKKLEIYDELIPADISLLDKEKEFFAHLEKRNKEQRLVSLINSLKRALREALAKNDVYEQKLQKTGKSFKQEKQSYESSIESLNGVIGKLQKQVSESKKYSKQEKAIQSDLMDHLQKLKEIERALEKLSGVEKK
ncbi:MAG: FecR family protein [Spirochaetota bacterium]